MAGSVLAIDHGERRTGFAATGPRRIAAHPLEAWSGPGDSTALLERVAELAAEREVATIVVGLPLNMDGSEGPRAAAVRVFLARLSERLPGVEVVAQDERLSTKEAEELLREAGHLRAELRARRDSWSALVILRDWLREA